MNSTNSRSPSRNEQKEKKKDRQWIKVGVVINGVLVLVSAGIYWVATQQTIDFERFSKIDLRAYVVLDSSDIKCQWNSNQVLEATIGCVNVGKTPATNYFHINKCVPIDTALIDWGENIMQKNQFEMADRHRNEHDAFGPNIPRPKHGMYDTVSSDDWKKVISGASRLILVGVIGYSDIFGEYHRTWYCFEGILNKGWVFNPKYSGAY